MSELQKTLKEPVQIEGKGLHTGLDVSLRILPAPENHGIIFKRTDLQDVPEVKAKVTNVVDTSRGTTLEENGTKVGTIEHLMAGLYGLQIDNAIIEVNAPEVPIINGSSGPFVNAICEAGIQDQNEDKIFYQIKEKIEYADPEKGIEIVIYPDDKFSINVLIDYDSRVLRNQFATLNSLDDFKEQVANCRTFVFLHELEFLLKNNLIKGGDLDNAIVIIDRPVSQEELDRLADLFNKPRVNVKPEGVLNNIDLYFANEPARHKLLDLIGDLSLVGMPIKGKIIATRPGHHANTQFAKSLYQLIKKETNKGFVPQVDIYKKPLMDINQIKNILPHRPPFLLIDKILEMDEKAVIGLKNVTMNEGFFIGHFPDEPIMPGVLRVEAMAQVGGILVLSSVPDPENYVTYFLKIDKVKFKGKVVPGDTLVFKCELLAPIRRGVAHMKGQAFVGKNLVTEAEMMAQIVKNK